MTCSRLGPLVSQRVYWLTSKLSIGELFLQPFCHFTYVTTYSPILRSLYLRHSSFSNPSVASPTSQYILQPFFRFSYVTSSSLNSPGEPPTVVVGITHRAGLLCTVYTVPIGSTSLIIVKAIFLLPL